MVMVLRRLSSTAACRRLQSLLSIGNLSSSIISSFSTASIREISTSSSSLLSPRFFSFASPAAVSIYASDCSVLLSHSFSGTTSQLPHITDPDIESAFKDLMAMSWNQILDSVVNNTKKALSKATEDKAGQEALANVFHAAEASVDFGGVLVLLRMALDDLSG